MYLWGQAFTVQGIAAVAVAPGERRRGVGRWICARAVRMGLEHGASLSALFPFRADFYSRLGYVLVGELHRYRFRPDELPDLEAHGGVLRMDREDAARSLPPFYRDAMYSTNGLVERTPQMWRHLLSEESSIHGLMGEGELLSGYAIVRGREGRFPDRSVLAVREVVVADADAYRAFLSWLSVQRDRWRYIEYDALPGERFHRVLAHPAIPGLPRARGLWFPSATILRGPMLRILDLRHVLGVSGLPEGAHLTVSDDQLPENSGTWIGTTDGPKRTSPDSRARAVSIGRLTELFVAGGLPGQRERARDWTPILGLTDLRILDVF
jgi:predicted acetyltransferase